MAPPRRWVSDAARKAAYRDRRKGIEHPDDYYNSTRSAVPEKQMTYLIEAPGLGLKVGLALNPEKRIRDLSTGSPVELRLLGTIPGGRAIESLIHEAMADRKLRAEWYSLDARDDLTTLFRILGSVHDTKEE